MNRLPVFALTALACLAATSGAAQTGFQPPAGMSDCRESTVRASDGRTATIIYCRNADGQLVRVAGTDLPKAPFPQSAAITYRGNYEGSNFQPGRPLRRLTLDQLLRSGGKTTPANGTIELVLRVNGNALSGTVRTDGSYRSYAVSGTQQGGQCSLSAADIGIAITGACSDQGFRGEVVQDQPNGRRFAAKFSAAPQ